MNENTLSAIIFDMDGTMVDNMPVHNRIWIDYLVELGAKPDPETFHDQTAGKMNTEIMRMFLGDGYSVEELASLGMEKELRYRAQFRGLARPMDGLLDLLESARQRGIKLAVATAAPPENAAFILEQLGVLPYFETVVHGGEISRSKPEPEIFLKAAERLGAPPERCLVFEDARLGVEAARRAGMRAVVVTTGIKPEAACQIPGVWKAIADFREVDLNELL
jgi:beta-phosphoglucomutase family hydrolase